MKKIKIITDSTADIPSELLEELNIGVVPLKVHLKGETYIDGVTIQPSEFYKLLQESDELPTTSQPSPVDFVEKYREAKEAGYEEIISIHLSSALSGTYQSAMLAKSMVEDEVNVEVIDSKGASYDFGIIVVEAARAAQAGRSLEECVALVNRLIKESYVLFLVDTLDYLLKGGRIGKASAVVGSLLNIKPILSLSDEGEVYPVEKVRGKSKAVERVFQLVGENLPSGPVRAAVMHSEAPEEAKKWADRLSDTFGVKDLITTYVGPVIGTHTGPKTVAVVLIPTSET